GVGIGWTQRGQATALARRDDKEDALLKLDDRLPYPAGLEAVSSAGRQALHGGRHRGQVLRVLARQILGGGDEQAVPRQDHGLPEARYAISQVIEEPGEIPYGSAVAARSVCRHQSSLSSAP